VVVLTRSVSAADDPAALGRLRLRIEAGAAIDDPGRLPRHAQRVVALATSVGAPLLTALDAAQEALDDIARARRAVQVASAQARAVAGGLIAAPFVLVPTLGRLTGADLGGFYTSSLGALVLGVGLLLITIGSTLVLVLVRRVGRPGDARPSAGTALVAPALVGGLAWWSLGVVPGLLGGLLVLVLARRSDQPPPTVGVDEAADLVATALGGGVSAPEALRLTAEQVPELADRLRRAAFGLELGMPVSVLAPDGEGPVRGPGRNPRSQDPFHRLVEVLWTADDLGAPSVPTLRRLATDLRADDLARVLAAAERLPVLLTFPTALCLLPATVLLVGAPIVHAGLVAAGT
jgi:Flp pilus assembly protein TadB